MNEEYKEVNFEKYCNTCTYKKLSENKDPCEECLDNPVNLNSSKPIKWDDTK